MIFYRRERLVFLPYLQCCFCENPRGLLQLIDRLYLADHFRLVFIYSFGIFFIVIDRVGIGVVIEVGIEVGVEVGAALASVSDIPLDTYLSRS